MAEREKKEALEKERASRGRRRVLVQADVKKFEPTTYHDLTLKGLYLVFVMVTILLNVDFGILAASSVEMKESLTLDNLRFGALQSMVFVGTIIGNLLMNLIIYQ